MGSSIWRDGAPQTSIWVAGLGNPGKRYELTRHNAGFWSVEQMKRQFELGSFQRRGRRGGRYERSEGTWSEFRLTLIKPLEFMNNSGPPIADELRERNAGPEDLVVVHDDIDLEAGQIRLKFGGGTGGHRGLESITTVLESKNFARVRIGIGRDPKVDPAVYVLEPLSRNGQDFEVLQSSVQESVEAFEILMTKGLGAAQSKYHRRSSS